MEETLNQKKLCPETSSGLQGPPVPIPTSQAPRLQLGEDSPSLQHFVDMCEKGMSHSAWQQEATHLVGFPGGAWVSGGDLLLTRGTSSRKTSSSGRDGSRADSIRVSETLCSQSAGLLGGYSAEHITAASFWVRNL